MDGLVLETIEVSYRGLLAPALTLDGLRLPPGDRLAVMGPSGSGKSTLVNVIAGLERPSRGTVRWNGVAVSALSEAGRDRWRAANVGLVMQDFHLFPGLSAIDNVLLPARLRRLRADRALRQRAEGLLQRVGIDRPRQSVETMSRGEMQRVAVARAMLTRPGLVIADEPTAALDLANGAVVGELLSDLAGAEKATLVVVTHDRGLAGRMSRRLEMLGGRVVAGLSEAA